MCYRSGAQSRMYLSRLKGKVEVGMSTLFCNRKDLVTLMRESSFLSHKRSAVDAHAAMGDFTTKRYCGGAQSELRPSKIEGMGHLRWACTLCSIKVIFYFIFKCL